MIKLYDTGVYVVNGSDILPEREIEKSQSALDGVDKDEVNGVVFNREEAKKGTITYSILVTHNKGDKENGKNEKNEKNLEIGFDSLTSHDITYVGIIQTARASGMEQFPLPFVMTNCHNSLCAVGGTINQDDHMFALSAAQKYGGIYVPPHLAIIHSYNREMMAGCGKMILGSDSHTRYGALGTMGVGEGGGELAKQLLGKTYDLPYPEVVGVFLTGKPRRGVGPHDVALSLIKAVFENGYVKNKVMEFLGDGVANLSVDYRNGIDVMTTETTCWSSIWKTDDKVCEYLTAHGREEDYKELAPRGVAYYDGMIHVDLSEIEPCIAMPFHPSNVYTIRELQKHAPEILAEAEENGAKILGISTLDFKLRGKFKNGGIFVDQAIVAGCSGGIYENVMAVVDTLGDASIGNGAFSMSLYPDSQPSYVELSRNGAIAKLMSAGVIVRSAFCGPCFGAGDTPANGEFSIRHTTRNFPNREGSKPGEGQIASVALMDARSIAATAMNGGRLTAADELETRYGRHSFFFDRNVYMKRVYDGTGKPLPDSPLVFGPNIKDWPKISSLADDLLVKIASYITDPVTTTDELIPSGETSSYRSNPLRLAEFTLSRKDAGYVERAKNARAMEETRDKGANSAEFIEICRKIMAIPGCQGVDPKRMSIGSAIYANKPGDGSAREQAASCQRVLGASANLAKEYATKRYRSNLINWGIIPFLTEDATRFKLGDYLIFPGIKKALTEKSDDIKAYVIGEKIVRIHLTIGNLTDVERQILIDGCLINYYRNS
ncbi:MAG: hydratase [Synergistaceae bacterium]|jgi:aconitate hydratase|nr:hydratase [Synergistaceae bacterium]